MIVGQVVDATTGAPVPEAIVRLTMPAQVVPDLRVAPDLPAPGGRVMADAEGRFFFTELPAGEYWLEATKDGYARGAYRQRRAGTQGERFRLGEAERRVDMTLPVWKHAVITGTVVDEAGEPVVGVAVRALVRRIVAGRPQYGTVSYLVPGATTDDRGMFRLPRVEPGTYVVVVPFTQTSVPVSVMSGMSASVLRSELARAGLSGREFPTLGHPRAQQFGDVVLLTMSSVLTPPPPAPDGRIQVYRTTYYPAATTVTEATPFTMEAGAERTGLAITLRPTPAVRVSGRLVTPDGTPPAPITLRLVGDAMRGVVTQSLGSSDPSAVGFETATGFSDANGGFTLVGVPPGEYVLAQANPFLVSAVREGRTAYWISQRVTVGDTDVTDLAVDARPAFRVDGRFEFHGANGLQPLPPTFGITTIVFETPSGGPGQVAASANRQTLAFSTVAAGGRYVVRASASGGWVVQSVTLDGRDITDRPFDLAADATSIVITYSDRPSGLSGTVKDAGGNPSESAIVLAFPVDRQRWAGHGTSPRHLRSAYAAPDGRYTFDHLPPGEYHVIAIEDAESDHWQDPRKLADLATRATTLTIAAGDASTTLDLTLRTIR
jgi:uncharacterized protein (DUF2141 family)